MQFVRPLIFAGAATLGLAVVATAGATGRSIAAQRTVTVKYGEYDLNSEAGAKALYARLRAASREVCAPFEGREQRMRGMWNACFKETLSNAVLQVNRDTVTALHQHATHGERAS